VKKRLLVLCTGNSARSQMAAGWVRHLLGDRWQVESAGTHPAPRVNPLAVRAMAEVGVDLAGETPRAVTPLLAQPFDLVITVCDAARESCPVFHGAREQLHLSFPDPTLADGTEEERLQVFRTVRDAIRDRLVPEAARRSAGAGGGAGGPGQAG
jgi:arsenate reductase